MSAYFGWLLVLARTILCEFFVFCVSFSSFSFSPKQCALHFLLLLLLLLLLDDVAFSPAAVSLVRCSRRYVCINFRYSNVDKQIEQLSLTARRRARCSARSCARCCSCLRCSVDFGGAFGFSTRITFSFVCLFVCLHCIKKQTYKKINISLFSLPSHHLFEHGRERNVVIRREFAAFADRQ